MSVNDVRYIVNAGCSYGAMSDSITHPKKYIKNPETRNSFTDKCVLTDTDIVTIDVSSSGQGTDWQSESVIYTVRSLLESGVHPDNIYVFIEWSQWSRISTHPLQLFKIDTSPFDIIERESDFLHKLSHDYETVTHHSTADLGLRPIKISESESYNIVQIEETIFMNVNSMEPESFYKLGYEYELFYNQTKKIQLELPHELQLRNYFNTIIKTQNFLKLHNIEYNCIHMQSDLSGWFVDNDGVVKHHITHEKSLVDKYDYKHNEFGEYITYNENNFPYELQNIEEVYPEFQIYFDQLDLDRFWFYDDGIVGRGGYDEWCLDTFKEVGYTDIHYRGEDDLDVFDLVPIHGHHPSFVLYQILWNEVAKNCYFFKMNPKFIDFLKEKVKEDYNYDSFSKHGITISKNWWINASNFNKSNNY